MVMLWYQVVLAMFVWPSHSQLYSRSQSFRPYKEPRILFVVPVNSVPTKTGFFNNLFTKSSECDAKFNSNGNPGTCTSYVRCLAKKGTFIGFCAFGTKACCRFDSTSGRLKARVGYFTSTNPAASSSSLTIVRANRLFCQVRLDFVSFTLDDPNQQGVCTSGSLTISGQTSNDITICGSNANQHMYLSFSTGSNIQMTVTTQLASASWRIKITQIKCADTANLAPSGCLQYFSEQSGTVQSFNYVSISSAATSPKTYQLANMDYEVCLSQSSSYCSVTWSRPSTATDYYFTMSSQVSLISNDSIIGSEYLADIGSTSCPNDYVLIRSSTYDINSTVGTENTFCGLGFPTSVTATGQPFRMVVHTDEQENQSAEIDDGNVGFSLQYTLESC